MISPKGLSHPAIDLGGSIEIARLILQENHYKLPKNMQDKYVMDIGANIGAFALAAAERGAKVTAVEPVSEIFSLLLENVFSLAYGGQIECIHAAVASYQGIGTMKLNGARASSFFIPTEDRKLELVPMITFDDLRRGRHIDFLKLDAEGGEVSVLDKLPGLGIPHIAVEVHSYLEPIKEKVLKDFDALKRWYNVEQIGEWEYFLCLK